MKKFFTLIVSALLGFTCVDAQTVTVNKTDGSSVTFKADDITNIVFSPAAETVDTTLLHEFTGYLLVTTQYFQNSYYGDSATIKVYRTSDNKVICKFHDGTWGDGTFDVTMGQGTISGTGAVTMADPRTGKGGTYSATLSGTMTNFNISLPDVMGGTTVNWIYGEVPAAYQIAGNYTGGDSVNVAGLYPYNSKENVTYKVTANTDGTINLVVPEVKYDETVMGDLTLGTYTISNIAYDDTEKAFVKAYKDDNIQFSFICVYKGDTTLNKVYTFDKDICKVVISKDAAGVLTVSNTYQMGAMPFAIYGTFRGKEE